MTKKIIYFTQGAVVSPEERAEIAAINAACVQPFALNVANGSVPDGLGATDDGEGGAVPIRVDCDFVAGAVPAAYQDVPVFDPEDLPGGDKAVIENGVLITLPVNGESVGLIPEVENGQITSITTSATAAIIVNSKVIAVDGGTVTVSVVDGAITASFTPD